MKFQLSFALGSVALTPCNAVVDCAYKTANYENGDYGAKIHGLELPIAGMGAKDSAGKPIDMKEVEELKKLFPKCDWKSNAENVKADKWKLPKCTGCTLLGKITSEECNSCGYADICEQLCAKGGNCGQVHYKDGDKTCQPLKVTRTCTANPSQKAHLQVGVESKGNDLKTSEMGAKFLTVASLEAYFPQCAWTSKQTLSLASIKKDGLPSVVTEKMWILNTCNKCGPKQDQACTQCELAEICGMLCSQSSKCKQFTFHGNHCHPKSAPGTLHAKSLLAKVAKITHISGKPIRMCYSWTQAGVDKAKADKKEAEYGQPAANKLVSSKVEATFTDTGYLKTALEGALVKRITCPEAMITGHAASLQPLWVALVAMAWAGMQ